MSETIVAAILSACITGVFTLIGKRLELRQQSVGGAAPASSGGGVATQLPAGAINYGRVVIDIGLLQLVGNLSGLVVGSLIGGALGGTTSFEAIMAAVQITNLIVGTIVLSAGYFWRGLSVDRSVRWKHFFLVAIGVGVTTVLVNSLILPIPFTFGTLLFALAQSFICMGIGTTLANRVRP
jgi:hypothetical protein